MHNKIKAAHKAIKLAREQLGLTQKDMARLCGIHWNTYARLERGEIKMTLERYMEIAEVLNIKF